ncbi:MAG: ChaN family lipoprotein [Betaproteobacteria bacterium]|nr:ChaN family lipoprotein [Betaproteobacteria bacterium]MBI2961310.1 ChaN family lipoprotein [Betaproteobacteria bacterium]
MPAGEWVAPGGARLEAGEVLARAARGAVVLLGETHDNADHHRWQLQTVAALAALRPKLVLGFEMFPRRVQAALDRWVAGDLSEEEFLKASDWSRVWGMETEHYLPLFHFARINRIPMLALNVERDFVQSVRSREFEAIPAEKREGVSAAAPASEAYVDWLFRIWAEHLEKGRVAARGDPDFRRFVDAELVWDSAMGQAIARSISRSPEALVVGIMGSGHIRNGYGVPHQLRSLGVTQTASLLPWSPDSDCAEFTPDLATAVFGLPALRPGRERPLLGVTLEAAPNGVRVRSVAQGSVAEAAGLRAGDVLIEAAGRTLKALGEVRSAVQAVAWGTWLPLKVRRADEIVELVAKFPPAK